MREPRDPGLEAIEQRLIARAGVATPTGHRDHVLAAVRNTLAQRHGPPPRAGFGIDAGGRAALVAMALSATLVIVAPWLAVATSVAPVQAEPRLVTQARAAGIDLPLAAVAVTGDLPRHVSAAAALPERRRLEAWRLQKNLLQGEL
jgi:hypothetical protein